MTRIFFIAILSVVFYSCSIPDDPAVIDTNFRSITVTNGALAPSVVNTDTILVNGTAQPNDQLTVSTVVTVRAGDRGSALSVAATMLDNQRSRTLGASNLFDNGLSPDLAANDSIYSGLLTFSFTRTLFGNLHAEISATDGSNISTTVSLPFSVTRFNKAPVVGAVTAPDTLTITTSVQILQLTAAVTDENGPGDITNVTLTSYRLPDTTTVRGTFPMFDDGGQNGAAGNTDPLPGDGIYSLSIQLPPGTIKATYRFVFQAFDAANAQSNKVYKDVVIQ